MDFELKSFEEKINEITEQFMTLLDSNNVEESITTRFDNTARGEEMPNHDSEPYRFESTIQPTVGEHHDEIHDAIPSHAIKFDEIDDLNKRLEELYSSRRNENVQYKVESGISFADYGVGSNSNISENSRDTNDKIYSANEKEGISMANYGYNGDDNSIFSFATVPQERAIAPKRSFSDVLFMDIPWDTKLDVWGGIKSFFNATVKFTF